MDVWAPAVKIFIFGLSSVFFVLGMLSLSIMATRGLIARFGDSSKKK